MRFLSQEIVEVIDGFDLTIDVDSVLVDYIQALQKTRDQMGQLAVIETALKKKIGEHLSHPAEGQKGYAVSKYKVTITSGLNYRLNKEEYQANIRQLPACFNPIYEKIEFKFNKKIIRECDKYGSEEEKALLARIIPSSPMPLRVTIEVPGK